MCLSRTSASCLGMLVWVNPLCAACLRVWGRAARAPTLTHTHAHVPGTTHALTCTPCRPAHAQEHKDKEHKKEHKEHKKDAKPSSSSSSSATTSKPGGSSSGGGGGGDRKSFFASLKGGSSSSGGGKGGSGTAAGAGGSSNKPQGRAPPQLKKVPAKPSDDYLSGLDLPPSSDDEEEVERREVDKGPLVVQVRGRVCVG